MRQLRFTSTDPRLMGMLGEKPLFDIPEDSMIVEYPNIGTRAYIHKEAESIAGYDMPLFFDGDMSQLDEDESKQDIVMCIGDNEYPIKSELQLGTMDNNSYYLTLKHIKQ